jgi:hypothetical protein
MYKGNRRDVKFNIDYIAFYIIEEKGEDIYLFWRAIDIETNEEFKEGRTAKSLFNFISVAKQLKKNNPMESGNLISPSAIKKEFADFYKLITDKRIYQTLLNYHPLDFKFKRDQNVWREIKQSYNKTVSLFAKLSKRFLLDLKKVNVPM